MENEDSFMGMAFLPKKYAGGCANILSAEMAALAKMTIE
jgi:hypothetical protein